MPVFKSKDDKGPRNLIERLTGHSREGDRTNLRPSTHHRNEGSGPWWLSAEWMWNPTIKGYYLGTLAKGWWTLGRKHTRDSCEVAVAVGGEDGMVQVGVALPWIARAYVGLKLPRKWLRPWVYQRREWAIMPGYIGHIAWLRFAFDDSANDMRDYYKRKRENPDCGNCQHYKEFHDDPVRVPPDRVKSLADVESLTKVIPNPEGRCITYAEVNHGSKPCECPGYVPSKLPWGGPALWPGWEVHIDIKWRDRVFGRRVYESKDVTPIMDRDYTVMGHPRLEGKRLAGVRAHVPMPEGNYPCIVTLTEDSWTRPRLKLTRRVIRRATVEMLVAIPSPGKGENSWDIDDDATSSMTTPARSVSEAVGAMAESVMSRRERYASRTWKPSEGFPAEVTRS